MHREKLREILLMLTADERNTLLRIMERTLQPDVNGECCVTDMHNILACVDQHKRRNIMHAMRRMITLDTAN